MVGQTPSNKIKRPMSSVPIMNGMLPKREDNVKDIFSQTNRPFETT